MEKIKKIVVGALITALFVVVGVSYFGEDTTVDKEQIVNQVFTEINKKLGAFPGPTLLADFLNFNGVEKAYRTQNIRTATSTLCSFKSPSATSAIESFYFKVDTATTTGQIIYLAASVNNNATTTNLDSFSMDTDKRSIGLYASSTIISPNTYINLNFDGANNDVVFSPGSSAFGNCMTEFTIL